MHLSTPEIDQLSIQYARQNIESNNLSHRITLLPTMPDRPILSPLSIDPAGTFVFHFLSLLSFPFVFIHHLRFDFSMCNPPFYSSAEEAASLADAKQMSPNAVCTGAHVEMVTLGGESAFLSQMVRESLEHRTRCRYESSFSLMHCTVS